MTCEVRVHELSTCTPFKRAFTKSVNASVEKSMIFRVSLASISRIGCGINNEDVSEVES